MPLTVVTSRTGKHVGRHKNMASSEPAPGNNFDFSTREGLMKFFDQADTDKNGVLSIRELEAAFRKQGHSMSRGHLKKQFMVYDLDGNEEISKEEFLVCMGQLPPSVEQKSKLREMFNMFDLNGDHQLEKEELRNVFKAVNPLKPKTDAELDQLIRLMDRNADRKISFDEFVTFFNVHK